MTGIPTVVVKLDDGTLTFPYTITQYVRLVAPLTYGRGRADENQTIQPGTLSLTLENIDGRFSQGNTTYHVSPDQMIQLTVAGSVEWTGRVQAWPVAWPSGGSEYANVTITATDLLASLSRQILRSAVDEEFAADGVVAHWPMSEGTDANSAHDIIGTGAGARLKIAHAAPVDFGSGAISVDPLFGVDMAVVDGSTGVQFTATTNLNGFLHGGGGSGTFTGSTHVEFLFKFVAGPSTATFRLLNIPLAGSTLGAGTGLLITYAGDGKITFTGPTFSGTVGTGIDDALPHVFSIEITGGSVDAYIDGVSGFHSGAAATRNFDLSEMYVGVSIATVGSGQIALSHLNIGPALSAARVLVHYNVILTDFLGELPTDRMTRLCTYVDGVTTGTLDTAGSATCSPANQAGKSGLDVVNELADATDGIVYIDGNGHLTNITGYTITQEDFASAILDALWSSPDTAVQVDMQNVVNRADGHADGSDNLYTFVDLNSISGSGTNPGHGIYPQSYTWHVASDDLAGDRTSWKVNRYSQPTPRVPELKFDLMTMDPTTLAQALTLDLGVFLECSNMPSQTPGGDQFLIVEGFTMTISDTEWSLTINGSRHAQSAAWILGDSFFGVLGASTTLYAG